MGDRAPASPLCPVPSPTLIASSQPETAVVRWVCRGVHDRDAVETAKQGRKYRRAF